MTNKANMIEKMVRMINGGIFLLVDYTIPAKSYIRKGCTDGSTSDVNPYWSRANDIVCHRENIQINLGVIYEKAVNGRLERKDIEPSFEAEAMQGKVAHINPHKNLCQSTDRSKTYIRYMPMKSGNKVTAFLLDGKDITADLVPYMAQIKEESGKQSDAGLEAGEQIPWRTLNIEHIDKVHNILGVCIE